MALAEVAAYTQALTTSSGIAQGIARAQTGALDPLAELAGTAYAPPAMVTIARQTWIATDDEPRRVESWTSLVPIPTGWHLVTQAEAATIQRSGAVVSSFPGNPSLADRSSQVAALTFAAPSPDAERNRRPSRAPREPRLPRAPREPRAPRDARPGRAPRAIRPRRPARPPRPARAPRPPRPPRPRSRKSKEPPGVCKGPGCNCWTPAGCIGAWYLEALPEFSKSDCYKGPCYDYGACVTERCNIHVDCLVNSILAFWTKTYKAIAANPLQVAQDAGSGLEFAARHAVRALEQGLAQLEIIRGSTGEVTEGCPPGTRWAWGLTGLSCQSPATHPRAATREELVRYGILPG